MAKEVILIEIKSFEDAIISKSDYWVSLQKLLAFGENTNYILGQYFHEGGRVSDKEVWVCLFQKFNFKDSPTSSTDINVWKNWAIKKYCDCVKKYEELNKEVEEYMQGFDSVSGNLSYQNTSHVEIAVNKHKLLLAEAEKILPEKYIEEIKELINFIQCTHSN